MKKMTLVAAGMILLSACSERSASAGDANREYMVDAAYKAYYPPATKDMIRAAKKAATIKQTKTSMGIVVAREYEPTYLDGSSYFRQIMKGAAAH